MKKYILSFLLIIISTVLFASDPVQNVKYSHGKIYLQNKDTIEVYIKNESLFKMQSGIHYLDKTGHEISLSPSKATGFSLFYKDDTLLFESRTDINPFVFTSKKDRSSFINRVSTGKLPLYYFINEKFFMEGKDMVTADIPVYMIPFNQDWFSISEENFVNDFKKLISRLKREYDENQLNALLLKLAKGNYKFEETPLIIEKFNTNKIQKIFN